MAITVHNPYRDDNLDSKYPFSDVSTLVGSNGFTIDPALFVDALLYPVANTNLLYLSTIQRNELSATITISNNTVKVYQGTVDLSDAVIDGTIALTDQSDRPAGVLIANPLLLRALLGWPQGTVTFGPGMADFVLSCIIPTPAVGVSGLHAADEVNLTGDVWLVGENGVILSVPDGNQIRVDIVGEPLVRRLLCSDGTGYEPPTYVKTINNIPPSDWGGFTLTIGRLLSAKPALRITPENNGIFIGLAAKSAGK